MANLLCFSQFEFDELCKINNWSDGFIPEENAYVSIIGSPDCIKYYIREPQEHYFKVENSQVCNLEFDDINEDIRIWKGHTILGLDEKQAEKLVKFIEENKGKNFYIHCMAGQSRSQGVVRYILDVYPDLYTEKDTRRDNPCLTPNIDVVAKLKRAWRKLYGGYGKES